MPETATMTGEEDRHASEDGIEVFDSQRAHAMIAEHKSLGRTLDALLSKVTAGAITRDQTIEMMSTMRENANAIDTLQRQVFPSMHSSKSSKRAQEAFAVPELCEMILLRLASPKDLMNVQLVNKQFRELVSSSNMLQTQLGLLPQKSPHFHAPLANIQFPEFRLECREAEPGSPGAQHTSVQVSVSLSEVLPKVGPIYRRMLLTQPPVTELSCSPLPCRAHWLGPDPHTTYFQKESGFTVGDVLDAANICASQAENCLKAGSDIHDADGIPRASVLFYGVIRLRNDDPSLEANHPVEKAKRREKQEVREKMRLFVEAKDRGKSSLLRHDGITDICVQLD